MRLCVFMNCNHLLKKKIYFSFYVCVLPVCLCTIPYSTRRVQKRASDPLELELWLWVAMRMLGTEFGSARKAARALHCWVISPVPPCFQRSIFWKRGDSSVGKLGLPSKCGSLSLGPQGQRNKPGPSASWQWGGREEESRACWLSQSSSRFSKRYCLKK